MQNLTPLFPMCEGDDGPNLFKNLAAKPTQKKLSYISAQDKIDIGDELVGFLSAAAARNL